MNSQNGISSSSKSKISLSSINSGPILRCIVGQSKSGLLSNILSNSAICIAISCNWRDILASSQLKFTNLILSLACIVGTVI